MVVEAMHVADAVATHFMTNYAPLNGVTLFFADV